MHLTTYFTILFVLIFVLILILRNANWDAKPVCIALWLMITMPITLFSTIVERGQTISVPPQQIFQIDKVFYITAKENDYDFTTELVPQIDWAKNSALIEKVQPYNIFGLEMGKSYQMKIVENK